jgi:glycosyltransferase involved in cell wall biosynthesis
MKILFLVESPVPYGANKCLIEIIDRLKSDGHSVMVVGSYSGALTEWLNQRGVEYTTIGHKLSIYPQTITLKDYAYFIPKLLRSACLNTRAFLKLVKICGKFKPDVIHTNIGPCCIGFLAAKFLRIPHVWHVREYQDLDFGMVTFPSKSVFRKLLKASDKVIFITKSIATHYKMLGEENSLVINDGVVSENQALEFYDKENYFLFAGRLEPAKGVEDTITSFIEFCKKDMTDTKLFIAGNGDDDYVSFLKSKVESSPFNDRVEFLGFRDDIFALMKRSKGLIVASKCEGFGLITPEAMFNGTIVIGRDTGGTSEILRDTEGNNYGYLFSTNEQLIDSMHKLKGLDEKSYNSLVSLAQKRVVSKYTLERNYNDIFDVYKYVNN